MSVFLCKYSKQCPVYNGKTKTNGTPLPVYRNVFCNRGSNGWKNCEQFMEYSKQELIQENERDN
jgi:hypothetical protein